MSIMDDLPPDHMPVGDLVRWLHAQLGRRPTLLELAELRCAMVLRTRRRKRGQRVPPRGREQSTPDYAREILGSEEGQVFLMALAVLPSLAATITAGHDVDSVERRTNPDGVLRLATETRTAAKLYPGAGATFEPPLRKQVQPVVEYLTYKIAGGPDFGAAMARPGTLCEPETLAAINAADEGTARGWRHRLDSDSDATKRTALSDMRAAGKSVLAQYPLLGRSLPGALAPAPETEADEIDAPKPPSPTR